MSGYIIPYRGVMPEIAGDAFIAPNATVIGKVTIGSQSSVWFNTVIRGDVMSISIGDRTNLQDGTIVHVTGGMFDTVIGSDVLIGHRAIIHGATLEDVDTTIVKKDAFSGGFGLGYDIDDNFTIVAEYSTQLSNSAGSDLDDIEIKGSGFGVSLQYFF